MRAVDDDCPNGIDVLSSQMGLDDSTRANRKSHRLVSRVQAMRIRSGRIRMKSFRRVRYVRQLDDMDSCIRMTSGGSNNLELTESGAVTSTSCSAPLKPPTVLARPDKRFKLPPTCSRCYAMAIIVFLLLFVVTVHGLNSLADHNSATTLEQHELDMPPSMPSPVSSLLILPPQPPEPLLPAAMVSPMLPPPCESFCASHVKAWLIKCSWRYCSGCNECYVSPPPVLPKPPTTPPCTPLPSGPPPCRPYPSLPPNPFVPPMYPPNPPFSPPWTSSTIEAINYRFNAGVPSNDIEAAGVLVHTFDAVDGMDQRNDLWQPCPGTMWCGSYDHLSASLINRRLPHFFDEAMGGLVLSPAALRPLNASLRCAFAYDAGTMGDRSGCPGGLCNDGGFADYCHWRSSELKEMLEQHLSLHNSQSARCGQSQCNYNEIVINELHWISVLPDIIEAIYFPLGSAGGERKARAVFDAFCQAFGSRVRNTPLISYDLSLPASPFRLVRTPPSDEYPPPRSPQPVQPSAPATPPPARPRSGSRISPDEIVSHLNAQFRDGKPSGELAECGVLVRQFDALSGLDRHRAWQPCPMEYWCAKYHAQWPASVVNAHMRHLYYSDTGGFVLDSRMITLFCAYGSECANQNTSNLSSCPKAVGAVQFSLLSLPCAQWQFDGTYMRWRVWR